MSRENNEAAELKHAEEVGFLMFPAADQSAEVVKPSEEAFDFPATAVTAQFTTVLGVLSAAISRLACCSSCRQDLQGPTCESFGFLPCVRAHSALVPKLHCPKSRRGEK